MDKRKILFLGMTFLLAGMIAGCTQSANGTQSSEYNQSINQMNYEDGAISISLSDEQIVVNGETISEDPNSAVYLGADMIYYKENQGETYGEGSKEEEYSEEEAQNHQVITITDPGTYVLSGKLSKGQIVVDLKEENACDNPEAKVELILNNVEITCDIAPAINVLNVYECGDFDEANATKDVDVTGKAGFKLTIADDSENIITGSHVAKIYKEGTTLEDIENGNAKKLHKYDAAIDSKMSMEIDGQQTGNGKLTVYADNEGIETRLHMTINGGNLVINANDDSINAGEDNISVITINGGVIICDSGYQNGEEGDGIDSNGWIVMNDGYLIACANKKSQDSGLDSDCGIYLNGGTVLASGHMYDKISSESKQNFIVLDFRNDIKENEILALLDEQENAVSAFYAVNDFSIVVYSAPDLKEGTYNLYNVTKVEGDLSGTIYSNITNYEKVKQFGYSQVGEGDRPGKPGEFGNENMMIIKPLPEDEIPFTGYKPLDEMPDRKPDQKPEEWNMPNMPIEGNTPPDGNTPPNGNFTGKLNGDFVLSKQQFYFSGITEM